MADTSPQEHCSSYYAATANEFSDYPVLKGDQTADVCVVGAGFTGVSTALNLAERGYDVVIVEANRVSWGASGRNGGQLISGISGTRKLRKKYGKEIDDMLWEMRWAGNEIVRKRIDQYDIKCDFKSAYIDVALKPRHMRDLEEDYDELSQHQFSYDFRMVPQEEIADIVGTKSYLGGLINNGNGHLHPLNLCLGEAKAAVKLGARIYEQSAVTRIDRGSKVRVHTETGSVEANFVVLAGNAYHALEKKDLGGILFPAGSFIMATEPLSEDMVKQINPLDLAVCDMNEVVDYFRLSADKRMLFGGRCNYSGRDPASIKKTLMPRMLDLYPQLENVRIDYEWGGKIGIAINRVPQIGRLDSNIFYGQAFSGHGVNATHLTGEILADAVSGTFERMDIFDAVKPIRIPGGQWFGNQLVALGMIYFRMRDLL